MSSKNKKKPTPRKSKKKRNQKARSKKIDNKIATEREDSNSYASWTGAAETSARRIFDTKTKVELDLSKYPGIQQYLPPVSAQAKDHVFVARVATVSKKTAGKTAGKEVVKLFVNQSWDPKVVSQLEAMDFTKVGSNYDRLVSDINIEIDASGGWKADCPVEIFRDLRGDKPMAKIVFTNSRSNHPDHLGPHSNGVTSISAFWCW